MRRHWSRRAELKWAGVAWMDMRLLSARLYSGSMSPEKGRIDHGGPFSGLRKDVGGRVQWRLFVMNVAKGGYYTEGRVVDPLRTGPPRHPSSSMQTAAVNVAPAGSDLSMTSRVVSVPSDLVPLVADGHPTRPESELARVGSTCGVYSCRQVSSRHRSSMEIGCRPLRPTER